MLVERTQTDIYPAQHFVTSEDKLKVAIKDIEQELEERLAELESQGKVLEAARLRQRTMYDLEMLQETGYLLRRRELLDAPLPPPPGEQPSTLLDYFPDDFLIFVDESHISLPQVRGMYAGDRAARTCWSSTASASLRPATTGR